MKRIVAALATTVAVVGGPGVGSAADDDQQFILNSPEGSRKTTVTATGVFNGVGRDVVVDDSFIPGPNGRFTFTSDDRFVFDEGRLFVSITGKGRETFDEENCSGSGSGKGSYEITGGRRLFDGASGDGKFTFDFAFALEQDENGNCIDDNSSGVFFAKLVGNLQLEGTVSM